MRGIHVDVVAEDAPEKLRKKYLAVKEQTVLIFNLFFCSTQLETSPLTALAKSLVG